MKRAFVTRIFMLWTLAMTLLVFAAVPVRAEGYSASNIRLIHFEGDVDIQDADGNSRFFIEGVRISSGESVITETDSTASISLDDSKILTLDQESRVKIDQKGNALTLTLEKGSLLLDVQEKLDENESLDIQTSTMTLGIRGTIIGVSVESVEAPKADAANQATAADSQAIGQAGSTVSSSKYTSLSLLHGTTLDSFLNGSKSESGIRSGSDLSALGYLLMLNGYSETQADELLKYENGTYPHWDEVTRILYAIYPNGLLFNLSDMNWHIPEDIGDDQPMISAADRPQATAALQKTTVFVLEGKGNLSYVDENNESHEVQLAAGQKATLEDQNVNTLVDTAPTVQDMTDADLEGFLNDQLDNSPTMTDRVQKASNLLDYPYDADGNWTVTSKVTMVAQSASKMYDGTPLTRFGGVRVVGVPSALNVTVFANGKQVDVGSCENPIVQYAIYNNKGENVTDHFSEIELISGTLVVDPAPVTIWTGSAEKTYDGTPLTCDEMEIHTVQGYETGEAEWRNTSAVVSESEGLEALYGLSGVTWAHGTNPLTGETTEIAISVGEKMSVYLYDNEEGGQSIEFRVESVSEDEIPENLLRMYAENPDLLAQACEDAGWDPDVVKARIAGLSSKSKTVAQQDGLLIDAAEKNNIMREFTNVRITVDTDYDYSDMPLNDTEAKYSRVDLSQDITITVTGTQTDVGESKNTYSIDWGTVNPNNYILTDDLGTLKVTPNEDEIVFSGGSASKVYDGTPLTAEVTVSGLPEGLTFEATSEGSRTDVGSSDSKVSDYRILNAENVDVTPFFTGITTEDGVLRVTPAYLYVSTGSAEKPYDGTPLSCAEASITGLIRGEYATINATGSITDPGTAVNAYQIDWGVTNPYNYSLVETLGTLTVTAANDSITFIASSDEKIYDGQPLTSAEVTVEGLPSGFSFDAVASGSQTEAGESENTVASYTIYNANGQDVTLGFTNVTTVSGTLTVNPAVAYITTGSADKVYDGQPLTSEETSIIGLALGDTVTVTATGSITQVGSADNTCLIDWGDVNPDNYEITEELGSLTVSMLEMTLDLGSVTADYSGDLILPNPTLTYQNGPHAGEAISAEIISARVPGALGFLASATDVTPGAGIRRQAASETRYRFHLFTGDTVDVTISGAESGAGVHTYSASVSVSGDGSISCDVSSITGASYTVSPAALTITTASAAKTYDGQPLTAPNVTVEGLQGADAITVTATGSITDVGSAANTYTIDWGDVDPDNYILTETLGTLTVTTNDTHYVITSGTSSAEYTSLGPLTNSSWTVEPAIPEGFSLEVTVTGSQNLAGTSENTIESYVVRNPEGEDRTASFSNVELVPGTLTVTRVKITAWSYCGDSLSSAADTYPYKGSSYRVGYAWQGVKAADDPTVWDLDITDKNPEWVKDVGTYTLAYTAVLNEEQRPDLVDKYEVGETRFGTVTITPAPLTIRTESATKSYDGTPLTAGAVLDGLLGVDALSDSASATATGSITGVGTAENTLGEVNWGEVNPDNYEITYEVGTLTVFCDTAITITAGSASRVYDGTALTCEEFTVSGLLDGYTVVAVFSGSQTNAGSSENTIASYQILDSDENDVTEFFTDVSTVPGTLTVSPLPVSITISDENYPYCGQYQGCSPTITCDNSNFTLEGSWLSDDEYIHWHIVWPWGDQLDFDVNGGRDVGDYTCSIGEVTASSGSVDNYAITVGGPANKNIYKMEVIFWCDPEFPEFVFGESVTLPEQPDAFYNNSIHGGQHIYPDSITNNGSDLHAHYTLFTGDEIEIDAALTGYDVGHHDVTTNYSVVKGNSANLDIIVNGMYEINPLPLTIQMEDGSYPYRGMHASNWPSIICDNADFTLTCDDWTADVPYTHWYINWGWGDVLEFDISAGKDVGTYSCAIENLAASGGSLSNYEISYANNPSTYEITEMQVIFWCDPGQGEYVYGESVLLPEQPDAFYNNSSHGGQHIYPDSITNNGSDLHAHYTLFTGDEIEIDAALTGYGVGHHDVTTKYSVVKGNSANFDIIVSGMYKINPLPVEIRMLDTSTPFDNAYHRGEFEVICDVETTLDTSGYYPALKIADAMFLLEVSPTGAKYAGTYETTCTVTKQYGDEANFNFTVTDGTLTITPIPMTIQTGSASKVYDGMPLMNSDVTVICDKNVGVIPNTTGSIVNVGSTLNTYAISDESFLENYVITDDLGTLTVTPLKVKFFVQVIKNGDGDVLDYRPAMECGSDDWGYEDTGDHQITVYWGWDDTVELTAVETNGTYDLTYRFTTGDESNYAITLGNPVDIVIE